MRVRKDRVARVDSHDHGRPEDAPHVASVARYAARAALVYALLGVAWVLLSDRAVALALPERWELLAQSLKGTVFILGTALYIYITVRSYGRDHARTIEAERESRERARQQAAVASLGRTALATGEDLEALCDSAARMLADTLGVRFAKVLELLPEGTELRLVAGVGWRPGVVGSATVPAGLESQAGFTLRARGPVIVEDLRSETRFSGPSLLRDHGIVSGMSTPIGPLESPWGVLGVHADEERRFTQDDVSFLVGIANVLASAIERVKAEEDLRAAEERYRSLVESIPAVTFVEVVGQDKPNVYVSPQIRDVLGIEPAEWIGSPRTVWVEFLHPDDADRLTTLWESALAAGEDFEAEYRMIGRDGRIVWVREVARFLPRDDDAPMQLQGLLFDITERKEAEERLSQAEERFRTLVERAPVVIYTQEVQADGSTETSYVSPHHYVMLGWTQQEATDNPRLWRELLHPDDRERVLLADAETNRSGEGFSLEYRVRRADGEYIWVRDEAAPLLDDEGKPRVWHGYVLDITARKAAEDALREAEERYRRLVEYTPGVVYIAAAGVGGVFYYVSPQVEELLGAKPEDWIADPGNWFDAIHEEDRDLVETVEGDVRQVGERFGYEYRIRAADGRTVWLRDVAEVVEGTPEGALLWGVMYDITESKQTEAEIRRFAERLEALHEIDRATLSAASAEEVIELSLDRLGALVPCDRAAVRIFDQGRSVLRLASSWQREGVDLSIPEEVEVLDPQSMELLERDVFVVSDIAELTQLPPVLRPLAEAGVRSGIGAALAGVDRPIGYLVVLSKTPARFDEEHVMVVREIAAELAIALRQGEFRQALRERADQMQELADQRQALLGKVVAAQEEERRRVARELHDALGQTLTAISLRTGALEMQAAAEIREEAVRLRELATAALTDSRRIVWGLRPADLETVGFVEAVRRVATDLASSSGVVIEVRVGEEGAFLPSEEEPIVLRILQEALNNAIRHAGATSIWVDLGSEGGAFSAAVSDDGIGFDPEGTDWGVGLISMRERAEVLGARLTVDPRPEGGTVVNLRLRDARSAGQGARG